jgi:hypothetical protein
MSRTANVISVQTLKDFKLAMITFGEDARASLSGVEMELRRVRDWLQRDQLGYWTSQIKKRHEDLMQARADLFKRKLSQQGSDSVSDAEQKENLRIAQNKLRFAEEKVALIKKLIPMLAEAAGEYHSHSQPLGDHLGGGFERSVLTLERMTVALESYLATRVPTTSNMATAGGGGGGSAASSKTNGTTTTNADGTVTEAAAGETPSDGASPEQPVADGANEKATAAAAV